MLTNAVVLTIALLSSQFQTATPSAAASQAVRPSTSQNSPADDVKTLPVDLKEQAPNNLVDPLPVIGRNEQVLGDPAAPVTLVEYASLTCVGCAAWHRETLPRIIERQVVTGRVRYVMRQLPTAPLEISYNAAAIVMCAVPDRRMNVAGALFDGQPAMIAGSPIENWYVLGINSSGRTRQEIEMCLADPTTLAALSEERRGGVMAGATVVPAFFINGRQTASGSIEDIEAAIEVALSATRNGAQPNAE